jgi:hypothetical protein
VEIYSSSSPFPFTQEYELHVYGEQNQFKWWWLPWEGGELLNRRCSSRGLSGMWERRLLHGWSSYSRPLRSLLMLRSCKRLCGIVEEKHGNRHTDSY